jgi:hypothetical protein
MISLGAAVLIAVILYLIDKNGKWPIAWLYAKRGLIVAGVILLIGAVYIGINEYSGHVKQNKAAMEAEAQGVARAKAEDEAMRAQQVQKEQDEANRQTFLDNDRKDEAKRQAAQRAEHTRNISLIQLKQIWYSGGWLRDIQIQNDTPETIRSITLAITRAQGEQPTYVKFSISIEPGKHSFFSKGERPNSSGLNGCATDQAQNIHCDYGLGLQAGEHAQIEVKDFEGGARR